MGQNETCKVTDFGMARDVLEENIYERKTKVMTADNEMNKSLIIVRSLSAKYRPDRYRRDKSVKFGTKLP